MDRFLYQQGLSPFMAPRQQQQQHALMGGRFVTKPKAEKKSHSEAESRRRKRINDHLTTLRSILPSKVKTDKATLLMETVQHVKELQRKCKEVAGVKTQLPSETDSVNVVSACENDVHEIKTDSLVVKASVCCEDRPELNRDLVQLIRSVRGEITRTEITIVGGRTKLTMTLRLGVGGNGGGEAEIGRLRRGLMAVVENRVSSYLEGMMGSSKRGRFIVSNRAEGGLLVGGVSNFSLR